jgi:predicted transcriptional regulator of viral defense system
MTGSDENAGSARPVRATETVNELASRQHGVVTRAQLRAAGVAGDVIDRLLKAKQLRRAHRGVYLVGPVLAPRAPEMAAVLACGGAGVLSHWSALALRQLQPVVNGAVPVEVSAIRGNRSGHRGVRVHRVRALRADEVTKLDGIPVTTVARTLYDLAGKAAPRELERALADALSRGLTSLAELRRVLERHAGQPGTRRLRALVEADVEPALTRSEAEARFVDLMRTAGLPLPAVNTSIAGYRVDFFWRAERFVVEVDGFAFHSSSTKFESDRRRDAELAAAGLRVVRVTWRQLTEEPVAVAAIVAQALARATAH